MPKGTVLFSSRAPIGYLDIAGNEVTTNQWFKSLVPQNGLGTHFLYAYLTTQIQNIEAIATGSTFKEISGTAMKAYQVLIPKNNLISEFENQINGVGKKQMALQGETQSLSTLRDTLLPKLISGELRVPEAEKMIAEEKA